MGVGVTAPGISLIAEGRMSSIQTFDFGMFRQMVEIRRVLRTACHVLNDASNAPEPIAGRSDLERRVSSLFRIVPPSAQRLDPGVELLRREFLLELLEQDDQKAFIDNDPSACRMHGERL